MTSLAIFAASLPRWTLGWSIATLALVGVVAVVAIWFSKTPIADRCAQTGFIIVLLVGMPLVLGTDLRATYDALGSDAESGKTSTVNKTTTTPGGTSQEQTVTETPEHTQTVDKTTTAADGTSVAERTLTVTPASKQTATKRTETPRTEAVEKTISDVQEGVLERLLSPGTMLLLRFAALVLLAFLIAAAIQRVLLGEYALTVGKLAIPAVTRAKVESAANKLGPAFTNAVARLKQHTESPEVPVPTPDYIWISDPRSKFLAFYVEIQHHIRMLAERAHLDPQRPIAALLQDLNRGGFISAPELAGYLDLLRYGQAVADGAPVDEEALQWLDSQDGGIAVLYNLDTIRVSSMALVIQLRHRLAIDGVGEVYATSDSSTVRRTEQVMIEISAHNNGPVETRAELSYGDSGLVIANLGQISPRASTTVTRIERIPDDAEGTWTVKVRLTWIDTYGLPGSMDAQLVCEIVDLPAEDMSSVTGEGPAV